VQCLQCFDNQCRQSNIIIIITKSVLLYPHGDKLDTTSRAAKTARMKTTLTPSEQIEPCERLGWFERIGDELVKIEAFAEHPAVRARGRVDLGKRQHPAPHLRVTTSSSSSSSSPSGTG